MARWPLSEAARLTTSTCRRGTAAAAERRFGPYWWLVGHGSELIRVELPRAVRSRAEAMDASG